MVNLQTLTRDEIQRAVDSQERQRQRLKAYYKTERGRLNQRKSVVRSILRRSGNFSEKEIFEIVSKIRLAGDEGGADRAGGENGGGVE